MSRLVDLGYIVAPTVQDFQSAAEYGRQKAVKEICERHPDKYRWVPDSTVSFNCPGSLECVSGTCEFTEQGCTAASVYPYYDCERHGIVCDLPTRNKFGVDLKCLPFDFECQEKQKQYNKGGQPGECDVCTFNIHNGNADTPQAQGGSPNGCYPGDYRFYNFVDPEEDQKSHEKGNLQNALCQSTYDPEPYSVDGEEVACQSDSDCKKSINRVSIPNGRCMKNPKAKAYNKCVDGGVRQRYLEYRKNYVQYTEDAGKDQCVIAQPQFRRWCEMPWQRPHHQDEESPTMPLEERIQAHPQTKMHPPFYYDTYGGDCYMTKSYCKNAVENGGYNTSFGKAHEYLSGVFKSCTTPRGQEASVRKGYDCCTPFGQSVAQFFTGRSLYSEIQDVVTGHMSIGQFIEGQPAKALVLVSFLSDAELKRDVALMQPDFAGPGIHAYMFTWAPLAHQLYPGQTHMSTKPRLGLLAQEVEAVYPDSVSRDAHGHCVITVQPDRFQTDAAYRRVVHALQLLDGFARP